MDLNIIAEQNIIELKEHLKEIFEVNLDEGTFYFQKSGLIIQSKILDTSIGPNKSILYVDFKDGTLLLDKFTKTTKLEKIPNKDKKFEWVFDICNIFDEHIGYIGKPSE